MQFTLKFTKERETKGAYRYKEEVVTGDSPKIDTFYIKKSASPELEHLDTLTLTIEG
jgi:hypothetical protein